MKLETMLKICWKKNTHSAGTNLYPTCEKDKTIRRLNKTPWCRSGSGLSTGASQWNIGPIVITWLSTRAVQWNIVPRVNTWLLTRASPWNTGPIVTQDYQPEPLNEIRDLE